MIEYLRIRDLGVISAAEVELGPGLVAITGETGAGKTMVMTALDLLFGGRPNPALIRAGAAKAEVEAGVRVDAVPELLDEREIEVDNGLLIVGRSVAAGRSRAWVGGRGAPASLLAELGDELVVRHGQNDQRKLASGAFRRQLLDRFAGTEDQLAAYRRAYESLRSLQDQLAAAQHSDREAAQRADLLRHGLAEIEACAPLPDEDEELVNEISRLSNVEALRQAAATAYQALREADQGSAEALLAIASRALEQASRDDEALREAAASLREAEVLVSETAGDLAGYLADLDADPVRLDAAQRRLAELRQVQRKYGDTLAEVLEWAERASRELLELDTAAERIPALVARIESAAAELAECAHRLSRARCEAADRLTGAIAEELAGLALPHAAVRVEVAVRDDAAGLPWPDGRRVAYRPDGCDDIRLLFRSHPAAPELPIGEGASGGELSRVMLALEVALAGANPVPVFVFDEVDAGIGGRAAVEVGRRLAALGRSAQVIVVTHLPQVAAFADQHIVVRKDVDGAVTESTVVSLDKAGRQQELARMLAGLDGSASAMAHAGELVDLAAAERAAAGRLEV